MTDKNLFKTCELFYASHYFPLACFDNDGTLIKHYCSYDNFKNVFEHNIGQYHADINPSIFTSYAGLYGAIKINKSGQTVLVGPYINKILTEDIFDHLIRQASLDWSEKENLKQFFDSIPKYSYNQFLNLLSFLHFLVNKEEISVTEHFKVTDTKFMQNIGTKHSKDIWTENQKFHGTYMFEQQLLSYISHGDVEGLTAFFNQVLKQQTFTEGKLADNTLRQSKNLFIGLVCMVGKAGAIKGNLDIEQTYQLIDLYTQECERCSSVDEVSTLRYNAIMDFTKRVGEMKHPDALSKEVFMALQFIKTHTNQPIGVMDVVNHVGKSRSTLLSQFKNETGESVGRYITKAKLQESKLLLTYSNKSLAEISNFFYFSSQSHFQNLFKKEYNITPLAYKKKKQITM